MNRSKHFAKKSSPKGAPVKSAVPPLQAKCFRVGNKMTALLKKYFVAGSLVLLPVIGTYWVLKTLVLGFDHLITSFFPESWQPQIPGIGFLFTLAAIVLTGAFTHLYLGKRLIHWGDRLIHRIPL